MTMYPCWWERGLNPGDFEIPPSWPPKREKKKRRRGKPKKKVFKRGVLATKRPWMQARYHLWESVDPTPIIAEKKKKYKKPPPDFFGRQLDGGWLKIHFDEKKRKWPKFDQFGVPPLKYYDKILLAFSGGKDSLACLLYLLEIAEQQGDKDFLKRLEIHHHLVDGIPWYDKEHGKKDWTFGTPGGVWDWPSTESYCIAVIDALGLSANLYFSWRMGGFSGLIFKRNSRRPPVAWETDTITPEGARKIRQKGGTSGTPKTMYKFPAPVADLRTRWCSGSLKIDVLDRQITNESKYEGVKTLVVTGERAEESPARATYFSFESHDTDLWKSKKRIVDQWRPVLLWPKEMVWDIIRAHRINPHICYTLGFGRCSCQFCVFSSPSQWKTNREISPERFETIAYWEYFLYDFWQKNWRKEGKKKPQPSIIDMNGITVIEKADDPTAGIYPNASSRELVRAANDTEYAYEPIVRKWKAPAGYHGEDTGPN